MIPDLMKLADLSIRTRIQLWHGLLLAGILIALGFVAWRLRWEDELRRMDRELTEPLSALHRAVHYPGNTPAFRPPQGEPMRDLPQNIDLTAEDEVRFAEEGFYYAVWHVDGSLAKSTANTPSGLVKPAKADAGLFATQWRTVGQQREAYRFTPPGACLLVGISTVPALAERAQLGWWLLALGLGVLGVALLVDAWILRRAIQPVEEIINAAERISHGNLAARIETGAAGVELNRLTQVLNHTFSSLDQAFAQQARFSADVAHELRTPVAVLITETQTALERERSSTDYRETIAACLRAARRMGELIESLLDLAHIQSGAATEHVGCDLATLAAETFASLQPLAAEQRITLVTDFKPAPCRGSASQLTQIIANLLINAIQHNQRDGQVGLTTQQEDGRALLRVENTGPGIAAKDLPHVFERFYRTDVSRNRKTGGVGLGLSIGKAIADAHGAELTVASTPGERTIFTLTLPRQGAV